MEKLVSKMLCALLGAALGPACKCGEHVAEYGAPHARYELSGRVVSSRGGEPIPGVEVSLSREHLAKTDAAGNFALEMVTYPTNTLTLQARDVDGAANGEYQDKSVTVTPTQKSKGSDAWDNGTFAKDGIAVELDEK